MVSAHSFKPARKRAGFACLCLTALSALAASAQHAPAVDAPATAPLTFRIVEGRVLNAFYQQGPVAAHLLLTSGTKPRVLTAFPAGNSGVGVWFEESRPVEWTLHDLKPLSQRDERGRPLHGILAEASVDGRLIVRDAVLGSIRVLRDYQLTGGYPADIASPAQLTPTRIEWSRPRLDGAAGYTLAIEVLDGEVRGGDGRALELVPKRERMRLSIAALTGETPLTPFGNAKLLRADAAQDARLRDVLGFLSYEEKLLAGSWRFNTYFGRDTLMSLRLLMPALAPQALEQGFLSVLERLAPNGEVAHEEDIGEFAILRHRAEGRENDSTPLYDYKMIDDDYMLAPVVAQYVFEHPDGCARAERFLASRTASGERVGTALARNFAFVVRTAQPFGDNPDAARLIALKDGLNVGQWRDSETGLGGGRYPYDVNAVLVPAALAAIARFADSGLLDPYLTPTDRMLLARAAQLAQVWSRRAAPLFRVTVAPHEARRQITAYAARIGVDARAALAALPEEPIAFSALALDRERRPIPVLHSDGGFALLLTDPPAERVEEIVTAMLRPFPAGLLTDAGLLVANPVFASTEHQAQLDRNAYHGTVVWSWQQALLAAGLDRQLARHDLPAATIAQLRTARERLWAAIGRTRELRSSELWSWRYENGRFAPAPFGQTSGDADESNAAQLWSTVYLGITPP